MIICDKCGAENADGMNFCTECGQVFDTIEPIKPKVEKKPKAKKAAKSTAKKTTKPKAEKVLDEDIIEKVPEEKDFNLDDKADEWADDNIMTSEYNELDDILDSNKPPIISPTVIKTTTIFTTKGKNNFSDKFIGLILLGFIIALSFISFSFTTDLSSSKDFYSMFIEISPLFIVALSGLLLARTGNIDFTPIAIMMVTYFMLVNGYNDQNFYIIALYILVGTIALGILSGALSALSLIPNALTSIGIVGLSFAYISTLIQNNAFKVFPNYGIFTTVYIPVALAIFAFLIVFITIFTSRLGRPMHQRKGIMTSDRLFFTFTHVLAYMLAAIAGFTASVNASIPIDMTSAVLISFDYMIAMIFIIGICGASSFFDNKVMPQLIFILAFVIWFDVNFVITKSFAAETSVIRDFGIKCFYLVLALIADRVYSRNQLPEYYNTTCVRK